MTTVQAEKIARRKLSLLQLAQELGNVSKACRLMGYNRQRLGPDYTSEDRPLTHPLSLRGTYVARECRT